ncbi:MAG: hypothetical protein LBJ67_00390 [Planctomycetaceae bacterium]|nr:hypothetical protein [Planctomycetaceae bacterium]
MTQNLDSARNMTLAGVSKKLIRFQELFLRLPHIILRFAKTPPRFAFVHGIFRVLEIREAAGSLRHCPNSLETKGLRDELKFLRIDTSLLMISSAPNVPTVPFVLLKYGAN